MKIWPFIPQREFTEALEWLTDVIVCKGAEQRIALRPTPRQSYAFQLQLTENQYNRAKSLVYGHGQGEFQLPLWGEFTRIGALAQGSTEVAFDTRFAQYYVGGPAIVLDEDDELEVLIIDTLTDTLMTFVGATTRSYSNAIIAPAQVVRLSQGVDFTRGPNDYVLASVYFSGTDSKDLAASTFPEYLGHPVMTDRSVLISDIKDRVLREVDTVDNGVGIVYAEPVSNWVSVTSQAGWSTLTRAELWALRQWLHFVRGKQKGFWLPTWGQDFVALSPIAALDDSIAIRAIGYSENYGIRDIMVRTHAGQNYYRRVTSATPGLGETELLTLSAPFGVSLAVADIESISLLNFMRFDSDRVEVRHRAARGASVLVPVTEVPTP